MHRRLIVLCALPAALAMTACGSSSSSDNGGSASSTPAAAPAKSTPAAPASTTSSSSAAAGGGAAVTVGESEFKLSPADAKTKAGKVTITIKNTGKTLHALALEKAGPGGKDVVSDPVPPGQTKTLTVKLKAGKVEWYCPIGNHKSLGMKGDLTVS
jgi:uncharacterized cupredoxin-like copper-binding protein